MVYVWLEMNSRDFEKHNTKNKNKSNKAFLEGYIKSSFYIYVIILQLILQIDIVRQTPLIHSFTGPLIQLRLLNSFLEHDGLPRKIMAYCSQKMCLRDLQLQTLVHLVKYASSVSSRSPNRKIEQVWLIFIE